MFIILLEIPPIGRRRMLSGAPAPAAGIFYFKIEILKLAVLSFLIIISGYSAAKKFLIFSSDEFKLITDYSYCTGERTKLPAQECYRIVDDAYLKANSKEGCKGYISKLTSCKQSFFRSKCSIELNNVNSCVKAVVTAAIKAAENDSHKIE